MQLTFLPPPDTYWTIEDEAQGEYKDKGSRFIAYAYPIDTEEDIKTYLEHLKKEHFKATHHCYAYRLGLSGNLYRANDDGEPSGTAGRPILGQIDSAGLTNVLIVVVRYYGGVNLGVGGLREAYKTVSKAALENAERIEKIVEIPLILTFDYAQMSDIMNYIKEKELRVLGNDYQEKAVLRISVRQSLVQTVSADLESLDNVQVQQGEIL